jgi:hypothetical protein
MTELQQLKIGNRFTIMSQKDKEIYSVAEQENSKRIFKSATPKYTLDWYLKWVASALILTSMGVRGIPELVVIDLTSSILGVGLWLIVSILWKDRALIILNGVGLLFLLRTAIERII